MIGNVIDELWARFFDMAFLQQFVTTFIGASLAIPAGIWIDRFIKNKQGKQERVQLRVALSEVLAENKKVLVDLESGLDKDEYLPLCSLDLYLLDATALKKYELLGSVTVCKKIDHARFALKNVDIQVALIRNMIADASGSPFVREDVKRIRLACKSQVIGARDAIVLAIEGLARVEKK